MKTYVMVPVPEELEHEVGRFLMEIDMRAVSMRAAGVIEIEAVGQMLESLTAECRDALSALARATAAGERVSIDDIAKSIHRSAHETVGIVQELQERMWQEFGPKISVVQSGSTAGDIEGIDWTARQVILWEDLAVAVNTVEQQPRSGA